MDVEIDRLEQEGRSIYTIGNEEDEMQGGDDGNDDGNDDGTLERAEDGVELDPSQEMNLTNKQREQMAK